MDQPQMTRRQRRLAQKQEREVQAIKNQPSRIRPWHIVLVVLVIGAVVGAVYGLKRLAATTPPATYTAEPVHWHTKFEVELCGAKQDFSSYGATQHAGSALLHTHGDGIIHIEGRVVHKEDIALGKFFDEIGVPFDRDRIMDKKNGDECPARGSSPGTPGKPGQVKMFANGKSSEAFRDYIPLGREKADEDVVRIVFE